MTAPRCSSVPASPCAFKQNEPPARREPLRASQCDPPGRLETCASASVAKEPHHTLLSWFLSFINGEKRQICEAAILDRTHDTLCRPMRPGNLRPAYMILSMKAGSRFQHSTSSSSRRAIPVVPGCMVCFNLLFTQVIWSSLSTTVVSSLERVPPCECHFTRGGRAASTLRSERGSGRRGAQRWWCAVCACACARRMRVGGG